MNSAEFDSFASSYEEVLRDPIRDRFGDREFFHSRKRDLILDRFRRRGADTLQMSYLDLGCGKGDLLVLLASAFRCSAGCDPSQQMLHEISGVPVRVQREPCSIPFESARFDLVTAICVYHHVPTSTRPALTREVQRVLRVGGAFCLIEHNPLNPVTRRIVSRTPVDADAVLVHEADARDVIREAGLEPEETVYFLFLPELLYRGFPNLERALGRIPLGGQYAVFAKRTK